MNMAKYKVNYYDSSNNLIDAEYWRYFEDARDMAIQYTRTRNMPALVVDTETGEILYG